MRKKLAIIFVALAIAALWVTPAFAAQGQITEVNPSGVNTVNQTDNSTGSDPGQAGAGNANSNAEKDASADNSAIDGGVTVDPFNQSDDGDPTGCTTVGGCP